MFGRLNLSATGVSGILDIMGAMLRDVEQQKAAKLLGDLKLTPRDMSVLDGTFPDGKDGPSAGQVVRRQASFLFDLVNKGHISDSQ